LDRGRGLVERELRDVGRGALAEDAAGREDLHDLRARVHLLAHGLAHFVRAVGDPADLEAVTARRGDASSGRHETRALDETPVDRAPQVDDHGAVRAEVADGRHPGAQRAQYRPPMPLPLIERLRARGFVPPDYAGHGLLNVAATVLDILGAREGDDPPPLADLDPALRDGVTHVVVILADGLGARQLERLCASGDTPFLASLVERAKRRDRGQLLQARTIFPSTTAAAITTLNTAHTPQEHGNLAYFVWLEEFAQVT